MKISILASDQFNLAFNKLISASLAPKTAFKLKKLALTIAQEVKVYEEIRTGLLQEYGKRDESGNIIQDEKGMVYLDMDKKEEFEPKLKEFNELETTAEITKISLEELGDKVELSASDLLALEAVICE